MRGAIACARGLDTMWTLQATIGWSYDLLSDDERRLFRRLAVFDNGWTVDGCSAVCGGSESDRAQVLNLLGSLVDKHLVSRSEDDEGNVRFGLLQTIRAFALERLAESGELAVSRRRHAVWCVALGEQADAELDSPAQTSWMERLEQERGNLRAALEWARTSTERDAAEAATGGHALVVLGRAGAHAGGARAAE
jgi:predicted ATPase